VIAPGGGSVCSMSVRWPGRCQAAVGSARMAFSALM
jgi:hypothetical protein